MLYILRAQEELVKLWRVVTKFETEIARNGSAGTFSARSLVKVVVLGVSGGTGESLRYLPIASPEQLLDRKSRQRRTRWF